MKTLLAVAALLALSACAGPYADALNKSPTPRPAAPMTKADSAAIAPYAGPQFTKGK